MFKILYLEDDINLSQTIAEFLEDNSFEVITVYTSTDALKILYSDIFDILLLDVNLPDMNGFELLKRLREADILVPTIFTTTLNDIDSLDIGYSLGADDYIRKPFALQELLHRINALLKREFKSKENIFIGSNIVFNIKTGILKKDNIEQKLTFKETQLLKILLKNKNKITPLEQIYETVWSSSENISDGSLRSYIRKLRLILGKDTIESIKKQGYRLVI